jgi:hypothetical protein
VTARPARARRPAASARVIEEWQRRVSAEYRSSAITQHLTLWLTQIGASPDLILAGLRIAEDELVHAQLSYQVVIAAGGAAAPEALDRASLGLSSHEGEPLEHSVLRACVGIFCLGETVAVPLFKELRAGCTVAVARRALDRILRDEVRHRDFGWALLTWLLETPRAPALREQLLSELPGLFGVVHQSYAAVASEAETEIDAADRAWGLMPTALYRSTVDRTFERDYLPRFSRLRIDPGPAWQRSSELYRNAAA